jgi:hypothetical protein
VLVTKALVLVAVFAAGGALGYVVHGESRGGPAAKGTVSTGSATHTYTLRNGDVVVRPSAATRCRAEAEGGFPNLFCDRTPNGRYQVIFYRDSVLVWPLSRGPDGPPFSYRWERRGRK